MKKLTLLLCIVALFVTMTGVAGAAKTQPGAFVIAGYTNPFVPTNIAQVPLPNGDVKFHLFAQGGNETPTDTAFCGYVASQIGLPVATPCADLCPILTGAPCGVSGSITGTFTFEEWGITRHPPSHLRWAPTMA